MCGRFTQNATWAEVHAFSQPLSIRFQGEVAPPRWNIGPMQAALIVREEALALQALNLQWGLRALPAAGKGVMPINARAETVFELPSFRSAIQRRRCVIPVRGWFEWRIEGKLRQPYWFYPRDQSLLWLAGIWQTDSFALLTTEALSVAAAIHDRSPVLLRTLDVETWILEQQAERLRPFFGNHNVPDIAVHAVSDRVNRASNEGEALIEPIASTQLF